MSKHIHDWVLVVGADYSQVNLIKAARARGYKCVVASIPGKYPGIQLADEFLPINVCNSHEIVAAARKYNVKAVLTAGNDVGLFSVGSVVDELGLFGPGRDAARIATNKIAMKRTLVAAHIPTADFRVVSSLKGAVQAADDFGYPVMVKAPDQSGSHGVTSVCEQCEMPGAWERSTLATSSPHIIIERQLIGQEYGCQVFVGAQDELFVIPHNDTVTPHPFCVPIGHSLPTDLDEVTYLRTKEIAASAIRSINVKYCAVNIDFILLDKVPYVIELSPRIGSTALPELLSAYFQVNCYDLLIDLSLGIMPSFPLSRRMPTASILLRSNVSGILQSIDVPNTIMKCPDLTHIRFFIEPGEKIKAFKEARDRLGELVVISDTVKNAENLCKYLSDIIRFNISQN